MAWIYLWRSIQMGKKLYTPTDLDFLVKVRKV
nr:MAG TPA: hypothetical protein [Caudoviricetes sp.]